MREAPGFFGDRETEIRDALYAAMDVHASAISNAERIAPLVLQAFLEGAVDASNRKRVGSRDAAQYTLHSFVRSLKEQASKEYR